MISIEGDSDGQNQAGFSECRFNQRFPKTGRQPAWRPAAVLFRRHRTGLEAGYRPEISH